MKRILIISMMILSLALSGCTGGKARELYETAELEELQNSHDHAARLYQKILDKYPASEYAVKARERLAAIKNRKTH